MSSNSENLLVAIALFLIGLPLGSFFNVVAYRLPRGQTPWSPSRSHCPHCDAQISARDNLPVIGWLMLRGKCRNCGAPISARYPIFEFLTAALFAACGAKFGWDVTLIPALLLVSTLVIVANSDLDKRIVPNKVLFVSLLAGVVAQALAYPDEWLTWTLSAIIAFTVMLLVALAYPRGMGMGDVKLAGVMGLYLGRAVAPSMLVAFFLGTVVGLGVMATRGVAAGRKTALPFAPFMAAGGVFGLFWGEDVVQWYLDTFANN
jgi:leader peptidase (prepilin peptidase)/N-methyltransferase